MGFVPTAADPAVKIGTLHPVLRKKTVYQGDEAD